MIGSSTIGANAGNDTPGNGTQPKMGHYAEAEELFRKALHVSESQLGEEHPDVVLLLNDFTRLYLKHSAYAAAEPMLERLLVLKRKKGEDHPEVATVLASLASVRQALGRHESAEQLWRRVLEIRERTLAPNHFGLVIALEHLADSCAARGKLRESLELMKRALQIRVLTLGVEHPSLHVSRERIADLELQASEDLLEPQVSDPSPSIPETWRLVPTQNRTIVPAPPPGIRSSVIHTWNAVPLVEREYRAAFPGEADDDPEAAATGTPRIDKSSREADEAQYASFVQRAREEHETSAEQQRDEFRLGAVLFPLLGLLRKQRREVLSVAVVLSFLGVALATSSSGSSDVDQPLAEPSISTVQVSPQVAVGGTAAFAEIGGHVLPTVTDPIRPEIVSRPTNPMSARTAPGSSTRKGSEKGDGEKENQASITIPSVSTGLMSRLDSVIRRVDAPVQAVKEWTPEESTPAPASRPFSIRDDGPTATYVPARLIGSIPTFRYPEQLSGIFGEVRVAFAVDVAGRPVMSSLSIISSPHMLLSEVVRKAIPRIRFEPALSAGPEPRPVVDTVRFRFQFARPSR